MTDNSRVLKDDFQIKHKGTLGLFATDPNQGGDHPGPAFGEITWLGKADKFHLTRWSDGKFEGFWPKKAREHPQGKVNFPLRMIPWLSPDAKHPGWRLPRRLNRRKSASCGHCSFRLISSPMKFPPQAVIGDSSAGPEALRHQVRIPCFSKPQREPC